MRRPVRDTGQFSGDPPLPVAWLTPANRPQGFFIVMKKQVLLVDDEPGVRRMLSRLLEEEGYIVLQAADGIEALEWTTSQTPDLVLLDLNLPAQNGWDTFERLSARNPYLPVIIITAKPNQLFPALAAGRTA